MGNNKLCFFNRSSVHYRQSIYNLLDKDLGVDFYFGDSRPGNIKEADIKQLKNFKSYLHNIDIGPFYWQTGVIKLLWSKYDTIITPGDPYALSTWVLLLLKHFTKKKIYLWTHGAYGNERGLKKWICKFRIQLCSGALLYGNYAKNILLGFGVKENKLHVIYNSLSYDEQIQIRKELYNSNFYADHFNNKNYNLVFIGRLTPIKKLDQILQALKILKDRNCDVNLTFVGDGSERVSLVELTEQLNLQQNVWFYGACYDEKQISKFLYNADVCVSPGNVGLTAMHAMTFGCPVISHSNFPMQMPEFEAIESGKSGDFFKENDIIDLSNVIYKWITKCTDRESVRNSCYEVIDSKYNPHMQIKTLKSILK